MGKGEILSDHGKGLYSINIHYNRERYDATILALEERIAVLDAEIIKLQTELVGDPNNATLQENLRFAQVKKLSAEKRIEYMEDNAPPTETRVVWCGDYTEELTGVVATMELPGDRDRGTVQIVPGYQDRSAWRHYEHGILTHVVTETPASAFYNLAMKPGWLRWRPIYRRGIIQSIDRGAGTATVEIEAATSVEQSLNVNEPDTQLENVPFDYMSCGHAAFKADDRVVVKFQGQPEAKGWTEPIIIGFQDNPKNCGFFCMSFMSGNSLYFYVNQYIRSINIDDALRAKHINLGFAAGSYKGIKTLIAVNFADAYPFRVAVLVEMNPNGTVFKAGQYAIAVVNVIPSPLSMEIDDVFYYSLFQELPDSKWRITNCEGSWTPNDTDPEELPINLGDIPHSNTCSTFLGPYSCSWYTLNAANICLTYPCCHRYYCPSTGEYADCSEDPCNGVCYIEGSGTPIVGPGWCGEGEECVDWQDHYIYCGDARTGDPCGTWAFPGCDPDHECVSEEGCGSASVTVSPPTSIEADDCYLSEDGNGPHPFGTSMSKEGAVSVYLSGDRGTTGLQQTFPVGGTQCVNKFDECGCTEDYSGAGTEQLAVIMPEGVRATPGFDVWMAEAADLYGEYTVGAIVETFFHGTYISRYTTRGQCSSNWATRPVITPADLIALGFRQYSYNETSGVWDYNDPGAWSYENLGVSPKTFGFPFSFPAAPEGEDPDFSSWRVYNSIRDDAFGMSLFISWATEYYRSHCSLGTNLALTPGLASPLDNSDQVACLVSNRDEEGNPGFAVCMGKSKILCFAGWETVVPEGSTEPHLNPKGSAAYTWNVALTTASLRGKVAFFAGSVPGIEIGT